MSAQRYVGPQHVRLLLSCDHHNSAAIPHTNGGAYCTLLPVRLRIGVVRVHTRPGNASRPAHTAHPHSPAPTSSRTGSSLVPRVRRGRLAYQRTVVRRSSEHFRLPGFGARLIWLKLGEACLVIPRNGALPAGTRQDCWLVSSAQPETIGGVCRRCLRCGFLCHR